VSTEKRCVTCTLIKPLDAFNRRATSTDGKQARCRDCAKAWYVLNRESQIRNVGIRNRRYRAEQRLLVIAYLAEHPCVDCGEDDLRCLEFDHDDPSSKSFMISQAIGVFSWARILTEIAKCSVRCASCHRIRTAVQHSWWSTRLEPQESGPPSLLGWRRRRSRVPGVFYVASDGLQPAWRRTPTG